MFDLFKTTVIIIIVLQTHIMLFYIHTSMTVTVMVTVYILQ